MTVSVATAVAGIILLLGSSGDGMARPSVAEPMMVQKPAPAPMQTAAADDFAAKKEQYGQGAKREMDEWQRKLSARADKAQNKGAQLGKDAQDGLDSAWTGAKEQWRRLQQASADGWDQARSSFERATQKMKDEWNRVHPEE